ALRAVELPPQQPLRRAPERGRERGQDRDRDCDQSDARRMTQLAIDLPHRPALGRADFLVSDCNEAALGWIERWPQWPAPALVLHGPAGSGKSHLAELWRARSGGVSVAGEDLPRFEPNELASRRAVALDDA